MREEYHAVVVDALARQCGSVDEQDIGALLMEQDSRAVNEVDPTIAD